MIKRFIRHLWHLICYCGFVAVACWLIGLVLFCVYAFSLRDNPSQEQEAVVVLTGGSQRIDTAVDLLKKRKARYLLISGVNKRVTEKQLLKRFPESVRNRITLGYEAENTVGNAVEVNKWLQERNVSTVLLVTSFYHMPRSVFEISRQNPSLLIYPWPVYPKQFGESVEWIKTRYAWLLFLEYHKFIFIHLKYWLS